VLKEAFGCAVLWEEAVRNVCDAVKPPRVPFREVEPLADDELAKLLQAVRGYNLEGPVWLAALTGLRRGEILGLSWSDVDLEAGALKVRRTLQQSAKGEVYFKDPKSVASRRQIGLPALAVEVLQTQKARQAAKKLLAGKAYRDDLDLVFAQGDGRPWKPDTFGRTFALFLKRRKMRKVNFHSLRHGFASALARQGVHPRVAQKLLGHSDPRLTMAIYSHSAPDLERAAVDRVANAVEVSLNKRVL
jgi:integrase